MLSNMAASLLKSDKKRIITTLAKAKALRRYVEPLITKAKTNTTHSRRIVFAYLEDKDAVTQLFSDIAGVIANRPGGYTRILKIGPRKGDATEMAMIELVDYNQFIKDSGKKKARRRKKAGTTTKAKAADVVETKAEEAQVETPAAEENTAEGEN